MRTFFWKHSKLLFCFLAYISIILGSAACCTAEPSTEDTAPPLEEASPTLTLAGATMCERIENLSPVNKAITFPVSIGQVYCLTSFDPVIKGTIIYHRWFHQDRLSTQIRLKLHPPRWSTFSTIHLREADKGPWRVEVTDSNGRIFTVLRFSVTD